MQQRYGSSKQAITQKDKEKFKEITGVHLNPIYVTMKEGDRSQSISYIITVILYVVSCSDFSHETRLALERKLI